eukprot:CAMPEP_0113579688 /NCGR_PEP_ID=MMETSP0015_2-20120614/30215_1 /TAXON_ID=2838 /ORGANISM="Odontella" /LENGTH=367 /DNA_ID=CAMNT_0000483711 /DNA_START=291 /DNA_END=1391 /DNA_ORIENTATION=- /assembly_acc=CAM_ASM_000160
MSPPATTEENEVETATTIVRDASSAADAIAEKARPQATPMLQPQTQAQSDEVLAAALALEYGGASLTAAEKVRLRRLARRQRDGSSISPTSSSLGSSREVKVRAASRSCRSGESNAKVVKKGSKKARKKGRLEVSGSADNSVDTSGSDVAATTHARIRSLDAEAAADEAVAAAKRKRKRGRPPKKKIEKDDCGFANALGDELSSPTIATIPHGETSKIVVGKDSGTNKDVLAYGYGDTDRSDSDDEANANASAADAAFAAFESGGFVEKKAGGKSSARALVLGPTKKCAPELNPKKKRGRPPKNKSFLMVPRASYAVGSASSTVAGSSDSSGEYASGASANPKAAFNATGSVPYFAGPCGNTGFSDA